MTEHDTRPDLPEPSVTSVGELLGDIASDLSALVRQEVELAKAEVRQSAEHAKAGGAMLGTAAVAGLLALAFLSVAVWWSLGEEIGRGWSAVVVALVWAVIAAIAAAMGRSRLRRVTPVAPRTAETTTRIPEAMRGHQ